MSKTIVQKVVFKNIPASTLYNTYMDAKEHSASVGVAAKIKNKEGARFSAHDHYVTGKNLHLVKNKLIVQSWRASDWSSSDVDSTFILAFEQTVMTVSLTWCMQMFRISILLALKKAGMTITGNRGKNILLKGQKNKRLLSEAETLIRL
jgi:activator of HSP90 ATPase